MKKQHLCLLLVFAVLCCFTVSAFAVNDGYVTFTTGGDMSEENFNVDQLFDDMEPGDTRSYTVHIKNANSKTTRWYMTNEVLSSLEASATGIGGGAYSYNLVYTDPDGKQTTLFDSDNIGGDEGYKRPDDNKERVGLREATEDLEDDFFLDTLNSGESGAVTLTVSLEGETQGNTYQNTRARIKMNFAVEALGGQTAVKTGDENNLLPYYIGMVVAGLLFLYLALDAYTDRKYKKGRG